MRRLDLQSNSISDISPLSGLSNLRWLKLGYNNITLFDYDLIPTPENSGITDISPLSGLSRLTTLELQYNSISDISPLSGLTNLESLDLWNNKITDISALSKLINLTELSLAHNSVARGDLSARLGLHAVRPGTREFTDYRTPRTWARSWVRDGLEQSRFPFCLTTTKKNSGSGGNTGDLGTCRAGLVVKPDESCDYKNGTFFVNSSGTGIIISGGLVMTAGNSHNQRGIINGVRWNFHASKNSGSNSWTIHTAN